jgi:PAS domain S-box-containing protein
MLEPMIVNKPPPPSFNSKYKAMSRVELIAQLESLPCAPNFSPEGCPAHRLQLELGMHQVELETQNQELRQSQALIEESRDRYSDLYDFAPVGYLTLDRQGHVLEINLTGAAMLGGDHAEIIGKPLIFWLQPECHDIFQQHLSRACGSSQRVVDEVLLRQKEGSQRHISMVSSGIGDGSNAWRACRTALVDITPLKEKEAELTESRQQLRNLSAHMDRVREYERRHLAREIHDELGQKLTILRFEVAMISAGLDAPQADISRTAATLLQQIDETIESVRSIASDLRPAVLDLGLAAAVEWQINEFRRRTGIACNLKISDEEIELDNDRSTAAFRIVQESLTNIMRHANASEVEVSMKKGDDCLEILISDNGVGMPDDALEKSRSFGIAGMRERIRLLDGILNINSRPGKGAQLKINIPLKDRRADACHRKHNGGVE